MKIKYLAFLVLVLLLAPSGAQAQSFAPMASEFCSSCFDESSARQAAWAFRPPVSCDWPSGQPEFPPPPDLTCHSWHRDVILANPNTNNIFSFRLHFDNETNMHVLEDRALSSDENGAVEVILDIYHALMNADFGYTVQGHEVTTFGATIQADGADCPEGTALDHVLNPELRGWMFEELRSQWVDVLAAFQNRDPRVSRSIGISASFGPLELTLGWSDGQGAGQPPTFLAGFVFPFGEVELNPPFQDILMFQVDEAAFRQNQFVMKARYREGLSRAAGWEVNVLLSGQTTIDNPCVLQKLENLQDQTRIEFRVGGPGGELFDFSTTPSGGGGGSELCTKRLCASSCVGDFCSGCQFEVVVIALCDDR